jgi:hypothetical protein
MTWCSLSNQKVMSQVREMFCKLFPLAEYGAHDHKKEDDADRHDNENLRCDLIDGVHYFFLDFFMSW